MNNKDMETHLYDDIINLPHPISKTHPRMSIADRAAQFAPFAALTGHEEAIQETARLTDEKAELDENAKAALDEKLRMIQEMLSQRPEITITYFCSDDKKKGGHYVSTTGQMKKIDVNGQAVVMMDGLWIPIGDIWEIEGEMF